MNLFTISQIGISIFGASAFLLVTREDVKSQKIGTIFGLISNPFWWTTIILTSQWYTIPVHLLYTYGWVRKAFVLWRKK